MMETKPYVDELRRQAGRALATTPDIPYHWREGALVFPPADPDGFEIILQPDADGVVMLTSVGLHEHHEGDPRDAVQEALGLARDLLSPDMRIRERRAGGRGYRWILERRHDDGWTAESQMGLLLWNYFGVRSERVYQNRQLPGRLADGQRSDGDGGSSMGAAG